MTARRAPLDALTLNRGDHAKYSGIRKAIRGHALTALQEMYSVPGILDDLEADGLGVWRGDRAGSRANPVVWDPGLFTVRETYCFELLPAGRRAGVRNMQKNLNVVVGQHHASRRRVAFGSAHNLHRQWMRGRGGPARRFNGEIVGWLEEFGCVRIVGMDSNTKPRGKSLEPIRRARGWDYDQLHKPITTHGRSWSPDGFAFTDSDEIDVLTYFGHRPVFVPGTDHRGNSARFLLTIKETTR